MILNQFPEYRELLQNRCNYVSGYSLPFAPHPKTYTHTQPPPTHPSLGNLFLLKMAVEKGSIYSLLFHL